MNTDTILTIDEVMEIYKQLEKEVCRICRKTKRKA